MHTGHTFLHDAFDLLEHVGVFFINPVSQITTIIQDLIENREKDEKRERLGEKKKKVKVTKIHGARVGSVKIFPIKSRFYLNIKKEICLSTDIF